jgi:hypothetical protein
VRNCSDRELAKSLEELKNIIFNEEKYYPLTAAALAKGLDESSESDTESEEEHTKF